MEEGESPEVCLVKIGEVGQEEAEAEVAKVKGWEVVGGEEGWSLGW